MWSLAHFGADVAVYQGLQLGLAKVRLATQDSLVEGVGLAMIFLAFSQKQGCDYTIAFSRQSQERKCLLMYFFNRKKLLFPEPYPFSSLPLSLCWLGIAGPR